MAKDSCRFSQQQRSILRIKPRLKTPIELHTSRNLNLCVIQEKDEVMIGLHRIPLAIRDMSIHNPLPIFVLRDAVSSSQEGFPRRSIRVHSTWVYLLHLLPAPTLRLACSRPLLLKEHICGVVDWIRIASVWSRHIPKPLQLHRLDILCLCMVLSHQCSEELGLRF